jgi:hypothetical protein
MDNRAAGVNHVGQIEKAIGRPLNGAGNDPDTVLRGCLAGPIERCLNGLGGKLYHIGEVIAGQIGFGKEDDPAATFGCCLDVVQRSLQVKFQPFGPVHLYARHLKGLGNFFKHDAVPSGMCTTTPRLQTVFKYVQNWVFVK